MTGYNRLRELEEGTKSEVKRKLIAELISVGSTTINELAKLVGLSIPTVTKLVSELQRLGWITTAGKLEIPGGRYPILYKLQEEAAYFIGVDVKHEYINIGIIDIVGVLRYTAYEIPYKLENSEEALSQLCDLVKEHVSLSGHKIREILNINFNIPGRINPMTGESHNLFNFDPTRSLADVLGERIGTRVSLDNDTRGMTYGEYTQGVGRHSKPRNMLYINASWGIGLGIIIDRKIHLGKSGFTGEIGHITTFDNQIICHCGKKGCFETEVSGNALRRMIIERIGAGESSILSEQVLAGEELSLEAIIKAAKQEDVLVLELLGQLGAKLGRQIAGLINTLNPEMVVIGGSLSQTGDYLLESILPVVRTYSLNIVNRDTEIVTAELGDRAGLIGACMQARIRRFSGNSVSNDY
ncbi:MAG: ROK family transcriptional regulator [Porphyromonas sp.]|nr:ROK family transcriptional regulator [Porphyromonas sp.]